MTSDTRHADPPGTPADLELLALNRHALSRLGVLRPALRVALMEQAISEAAIASPAAEQLQAMEQRFWRQQRIAPKQQQRWLEQQQLSLGDLHGVASRPWRWSQWCQQQWGEKLEALFLKHKDKLDRATAFLLELEDPGLARELYLQLEEGEATFNELSRTYCRDHPQRRGVQVGPTSLSELPPALAELIRSSPPQTVRAPQRIAPQRWAILRVEQFQPASLNDPAVPPRLLRMEGEAELQQRIQRWLSQQASSTQEG